MNPIIQYGTRNKIPTEYSNRPLSYNWDPKEKFHYCAPTLQLPHENNYCLRNKLYISEKPFEIENYSNIETKQNHLWVNQKPYNQPTAILMSNHVAHYYFLEIYLH